VTKLTKQQFYYLTNRHEEIKRKRKAIEVARYDMPQNDYIKPWTKRKRGVLMGKVEEMLIKYHEINKDILKLSKDLRTAIEAETNNDGCIKASVISDTPKGIGTSEPTYSHTEDLIEQLEEIGIELANMAKETKEQMQDLLYTKSQIDIAYFALEPEEQTIIRLRYFDMPAPQYTWKQVSEAAHYSESQVFAIHKQAVKNIKEILRIGVNRSQEVV
jgi:DNA-directed RNA polymerase specialized sigma subunit